MTTYKDVPPELRDYIEGLMYEVNARKDVVAFMIDRGMTESPAFPAYHKEYVEYCARYEAAKAELTARFVAPDYPNARWTLNFEQCRLEIEYDA